MNAFESPEDKNPIDPEKLDPQEKTVERIVELAREIIIKDIKAGAESDLAGNYKLIIDGIEYGISIDFNFRNAEDETLPKDTFVAEISIYFDRGTSYHSEQYAIRKNGEVVKSQHIDARVKEESLESYPVSEQAEIIATPDQAVTVPTNEGDMQRIVRLLEDLKNRKSQGEPREDID
jgi:hypothetical protein